MFLKPLRMFLVFFITTTFVAAQDCTLDVGGTNSDVLVQVFQLNEEQSTQMETWRTELRIEIKTVEDEIQKLFDSHPQSSPEELTVLAQKYKVYQEKIVEASIATDKKLLSIFNVKQYDRYIELCHEAVREPFRVTPITTPKADEEPK